MYHANQTFDIAALRQEEEKGFQNVFGSDFFRKFPPPSKMLLPSEQRFWISALSAVVCFLSAASAGLRYNYGDGSFYVGQVDEKGRPDGIGKYFNTTGALGKFK